MSHSGQVRWAKTQIKGETCLIIRLYR